MRKFLSSLLVSFLVLSALPLFSGEAHAGGATLKFFYGQGCPHCTEAKPFVESLKTKYPELTVELYEVWYNAENKLKFSAAAKAINADVRGVPAFFIGDDHVVGYGSDETTGKQLEELVKKYLGTAGQTALSDVADSTYATAIEALLSKYIIKGYADNTFRPKNTINRAEFLKILMEAKYPKAAVGSFCFSDVTTDWFAPYVCHAKSLGIVKGYADKSFKPASTINHAEALKMLVETFGFETSEVEGEWYAKYVNSAQANNFHLGKSLSAIVTREQMAEMVHRILELQKE